MLDFVHHVFSVAQSFKYKVILKVLSISNATFSVQHLTVLICSLSGCEDLSYNIFFFFPLVNKIHNLITNHHEIQRSLFKPQDTSPVIRRDFLCTKCHLL